MTNTTPAPSAPPASSRSFPEWVLLGPCVVVGLGQDHFLFVSPAGDVFRVSLVAGEFIDASGETIPVDDGFLGLWDIPFTLGPEFGASFAWNEEGVL